MSLEVDCFVAPPLGENTYLVWERESRAALLVDPGGELDAVAERLAGEGLRLEAIVNTHAHVDHVAAAAEARRFGAPLHLHPGDRGLLEMLPLQAAMFGFGHAQVPSVDDWLADGQELTLGSTRVRVLHTPGHSPGGCCLFFPEEKVLFTGDTLFAGSIGRTDLPGGSLAQLTEAIRGKLFPLGDEVTFYPGHGGSGTLGEERRTNPFVGE